MTCTTLKKRRRLITISIQRQYRNENFKKERKKQGNRSMFEKNIDWEKNEGREKTCKNPLYL